MADEVRAERDGPVLVVTLNRPEVRNAVNGAAARVVAAAVDVLDEDPELVVGILTGAGGTFSSGMDLKAFLTGDVPLIEGRGFAGIAMEYALTGDPFGAEDAARWGLVNRLTEPGGALAGARELAARIAANGPLAVRATKQIVAGAPDWPAEERWARQDELLGPVFTSADAQEGARAFAEKRAPVWRGE
jgi:enoyl-CoA hydratase